MRALKIDIFHDETFVFTPKGDVVTLPQGATVIDFAYAIHSGVGNKMVGAKINGMIVPIDRAPQNGEIVEIITSAASKGPSRDWLKIVKTGEARTKIRQWFKKEQRPENILVGKNEIDREFKRYPRSCTEAQHAEILQNIIAKLGIQSVEDLYNTIGYGGITMSKLSGKLRDEFENIVKPDSATTPITDASQLQTSAIPKSRKNSSGITIDGVDGCQVKFARCCNPLPGDRLVGFITKGYGVSVHKQDCPNVILNRPKAEYSGRWVTARWETPSGASDNLFEAMLHILAENRITLIADISSALADMKVSILQINTQKHNSNEIILSLVISCRNTDHLKSIVARLKGIQSVENVERGYT